MWRLSAGILCLVLGVACHHEQEIPAENQEALTDSMLNLRVTEAVLPVLSPALAGIDTHGGVVKLHLNTSVWDSMPEEQQKEWLTRAAAVFTERVPDAKRVYAYVRERRVATIKP